MYTMNELNQLLPFIIRFLPENTELQFAKAHHNYPVTLCLHHLTDLGKMVVVGYRHFHSKREAHNEYYRYFYCHAWIMWAWVEVLKIMPHEHTLYAANKRVAVKIVENVANPSYIKRSYVVFKDDTVFYSGDNVATAGQIAAAIAGIWE